MVGWVAAEIRRGPRPGRRWRSKPGCRSDGATRWRDRLRANPGWLPRGPARQGRRLREFRPRSRAPGQMTWRSGSRSGRLRPRWRPLRSGYQQLGSGIDPLVDPPAQVDQRGPKWSMTEVDRDDVPAAFVECQQCRGLPTGRGSMAQFTQQAVIYEFTDKAGDRGPGQTGLTGDLGPAGRTTMRDQFERGTEVAASGVVLGGFGVPGQVSV